MTVGLFDSHAHYDDSRFDGMRDEIIGKLPDAGVGYVVNIGASLEGSARSRELAEKYDFFYYAAGVHPDATETLDDPNWKEKLRALLAHEKCRALGEIGLDYYYGKEDKDRQLILFEEQLKIAEELSLPVIVHDREAHGDALDMIKKHPKVKGVFHCFSGSAETARELFSLGWYISVGGVITFKNAKKLVEVVEALPTLHPDSLSRLMLETDCPYLAPVPHRGEINHSGLMHFACEKVAELLGMTSDEVARLTSDNAVRFYGL